MPTVKRFEELRIWQLARSLNQKNRKIILQLREEYEFKLAGQMDSSCGSAMDNIAEGFDRGGNQEFIQFLGIAKGSGGEYKSQLYRCFDFGFIINNEFEMLYSEIDDIQNQIGNLIKYLNRGTYKGPRFKKNP